VFNIRDSENVKKGSTKEFRAYRGISRLKVNQEVVLVRNLGENGQILLLLWDAWDMNNFYFLFFYFFDFIGILFSFLFFVDDEEARDIAVT